MRPYVVVHAAVSLDGRLSGFPIDLAKYYECARSFGEDATLIGADTLLAAEPELADPGAGPPPAPPTLHPDDERPIAVVVDSRGRVKGIHKLRATPYWRNVLVLCSESTPPEHRTLLEKCRVGCLVTGTDRVDLATALEILHDGYHVEKVRVDAGGQLIGAMLRAGLVDELSLLLHPLIVGDEAATPLLPSLPGATGDAEPVLLDPISVEALDDGLLWLRYNALTDEDYEEG